MTQRERSAGPGDAAAARRERILDAAESRFAEAGFDATGTAAIADAARVPKGLVFYYFPRKIDILRALLDERLPGAPLCEPGEVARRGDPVGSLLRLARRLRRRDRHRRLRRGRGRCRDRGGRRHRQRG